MQRLILAAMLVIVPLSGCLGIPDGTIAPGDRVNAQIHVVDADTGDLLIAPTTTTFAVGQGQSGLGFEFERRLVGQPEDLDAQLLVRDDPSLTWSRQVQVDRVFETPLQGSLGQSQFEQAFGSLSPGEVFEPQGSFFPYRVVAVGGGFVTYEAMPTHGQQDPVDHVGATLTTTVEGSNMVQTLEPVVGATFRILPPSAFNPSTPLGLAPGSYRSVGVDGGHIVYDFSRNSNPATVGHDLLVHITINGVVPGQTPAVEPVDGNYGVRTSPVINGAATSFTSFGPLSGDASSASDDHGDHDH